MKCIVKTRYICILFILTLLFGLTACQEEVEFQQKYTAIPEDTYDVSLDSVPSEVGAFFGSSYCVGGNENIPVEGVKNSLSKSAALFDLSNGSILYANQIHERIYPASTTKILTAYLALKYGNLEETTTVSTTALKLDPGSSLCGLSVGDQLTLEELLYGLMLKSGNDAANVIAEMISGSIEEFAKLMNQEALAMGATNSSFVNPHGLHSDQHYTTAYDLYIIFQNALEFEVFEEIINTSSYEAVYNNKKGEAVSKVWKSTNKYLTSEVKTPEGVTVIGGKTGTTYAAGNCLILYSKNQMGEPFISVVLKGESKDNLYYQMTEILEIISN